MWILPKSLMSAFAPVMGASTSDCGELSQICAQSLMQRSKPSRANFFLREWKAGRLMRLQYGAISSHSRGQRFLDAWTSSLEVTHASHSAQPESDLAQKTNDTSGHSSQMEFGFFDLECASLKTSKDTSRWDSPQSSAIWKSWILKCRGEYLARRNASMQMDAQHRTSASECSSWPTIRVRQGEDCASERNRKSPSLDSMVKQAGHLAPENHSTVGSRRGLWPTPNCMDVITPTRDLTQMESKGHWGKSMNTGKLSEMVNYGPPDPENHSTHGNRRGLSAVQNPQWATPRPPNGGQTTSGAADKQSKRQIMIQHQVSGKLNPRWVETLQGVCMGWTSPSCPASVIRNWPKFMSGWSNVTIEPTNSGCSGMESCQPPPQGHLPF